MKKRDQEPLKLMPLDGFGRLVSTIASIAKEAVTKQKPTPRQTKRKRSKLR